MRTTLIRAVLFALGLGLGLAAATALASSVPFPWPDWRSNPRVILNANQDIETYLKEHPRWFRKDFLVAGPYISNVEYGQSDEAAQNFRFLKHALRNQNIFSGTYISGSTVIHEPSVTTYPANAIAIEDLPRGMRYLGPWMREPVQQVVDLRDPGSRNALHEQIRLLWAHEPALMRFVDNAAVHPRVAKLQPWWAYCQNIKELRMLAEAQQGNAVFNIFARPWEMSQPEIALLADAVRGNGGNAIAFALPWSKTIKDNKNANGWAIFRYRQLLRVGIAIILEPPIDTKTDGTEEDLEAWVATWRQPGDRLYLETPYWEVP